MIKKMIAKYREKIANCDVMLEVTKARRKEAHRLADRHTIRDCYIVQTRWDARKAAYQQALVDFESLLPHPWQTTPIVDDVTYILHQQKGKP